MVINQQNPRSEPHDKAPVPSGSGRAQRVPQVHWGQSNALVQPEQAGGGPDGSVGELHAQQVQWPAWHMGRRSHQPLRLHGVHRAQVCNKAVGLSELLLWE